MLIDRVSKYGFCQVELEMDDYSGVAKEIIRKVEQIKVVLAETAAKDKNINQTKSELTSTILQLEEKNRQLVREMKELEDTHRKDLEEVQVVINDLNRLLETHDE